MEIPKLPPNNPGFADYFYQEGYRTFELTAPLVGNFPQKPCPHCGRTLLLGETRWLCPWLVEEDEVKALSLWQPWAFFILLLKRWETRS